MWEYNFESIPNHLGYSARAMKYDLNYLNIQIGDLSGDHSINIYDAILLIDLLFQEDYENLGDLNQDNIINIEDLNKIIELIMSF